MFLPINQVWSLDYWNDEIKEAVIIALAKIHNLDIVVKRIRSPKDFRVSMHMFGGAVYGLSPAADPMALFPHRTPIEGLFQAGQTTYPGYGVGPAILSGISASEALMKKFRRRAL